jgi:hypothetical protein
MPRLRGRDAPRRSARSTSRLLRRASGRRPLEASTRALDRLVEAAVNDTSWPCSMQRHFLHAFWRGLSGPVWACSKFCYMYKHLDLLRHGVRSIVDDMILVEDAAMWAGAAVAAWSSLEATASECDDVVRSCDEVMRSLRGNEGCAWEDAEVWVVVDDMTRGIMEHAAMWVGASVAAGLSQDATAGKCDGVARSCYGVMRTSCACEDECTNASLGQAVPALSEAPTLTAVADSASLELYAAAPPSPEPGQRAHLRSLLMLARLPRVSRLVDSQRHSQRDRQRDRQRDSPVSEQADTEARCAPGAANDEPSSCQQYEAQDTRASTPRYEASALQQRSSPQLPQRPVPVRVQGPGPVRPPTPVQRSPPCSQPRVLPVPHPDLSCGTCDNLLKNLRPASSEAGMREHEAVLAKQLRKQQRRLEPEMGAQVSAAARSSQAKDAKAERLQEQRRQHSGTLFARSAPTLPAAHRPGLQIGATYTSHELLDAILYKPALIPKGSTALIPKGSKALIPKGCTTTRRPTSRTRHGALAGQHRSAPLLTLEPAAIPWEGRLAGRAESDLLVWPPCAPHRPRSHRCFGVVHPSAPQYGTSTSTASSGRQHRQPPPALSRTGPSFLDPYDQCTRYGYIDQFRKIGESSSSIESRRIG